MAGFRAPYHASLSSSSVLDMDRQAPSSQQTTFPYHTHGHGHGHGHGPSHFTSSPHSAFHSIDSPYPPYATKQSMSDFSTTLGHGDPDPESATIDAVNQHHAPDSGEDPPSGRTATLLARLRRLVPNSFYCRLYLLVVLVESTIDVVIEGIIYLKMKDALDGLEAASSTDKQANDLTIKRLPVYLGIFAFAHVYQFILAMFAVHQRNIMQFVFLGRKSLSYLVIRLLLTCPSLQHGAPHLLCHPNIRNSCQIRRRHQGGFPTNRQDPHFYHPLRNFTRTDSLCRPCVENLSGIWLEGQSGIHFPRSNRLTNPDSPRPGLQTSCVSSNLTASFGSAFPYRQVAFPLSRAPLCSRLYIVSGPSSQSWRCRVLPHNGHDPRLFLDIARWPPGSPGDFNPFLVDYFWIGIVGVEQFRQGVKEAEYVPAYYYQPPLTPTSIPWASFVSLDKADHAKKQAENMGISGHKRTGTVASSYMMNGTNGPKRNNRMSIDAYLFIAPSYPAV
ncbi:hypothetical protein AG1IA_01055 [Rhizoctonia solani AG-1 IA]|uniref:Uncharacterized protein n=1 Tax=Thanatephorus cucumeris (strain AG1-IA) TaxID=983506 RepID=L8X3W8_THACA|nr:hypothetical protein AG1IA_01055 [Rhizoctonia solani AG-1 IA]